MIKLLSNIGRISATIRKVADTLKVGADAFDVLKNLNSIWASTEEPKKEEEQQQKTDLKDE